MTKSLMIATCLAATVGFANAQPLPAPPTAKYTALNVQTCDTQTLQVYFQSGETTLSAASEALLAAAKSSLENCVIGPASLQAIAADAPSRDSADQLAEARISSVTAALDRYHLSEGQIDADITAIAPAKYSAPGDRKVEIRLTAWRPELG